MIRHDAYGSSDFPIAGKELDKTLQKIKDAGMEVNTVDKNLFKQAISPVYEKYNAQYGDLLKEIEKAKEM